MFSFCDVMLSVIVFVALFSARAAAARFYWVTGPIIRSLDLASFPLQETESVRLPPPIFFLLILTLTFEFLDNRL